MDQKQLLWIAFLLEGGLILLAWVLSALLEKPLFHNSFLSLQTVGWGILASLPLFISVYWIYRSPWPPFQRFKQKVNELVYQFFAKCTVMDLAFISILAGIGEEAFFRGIIQGFLVDSLPLWLAIFISGLIFGLAHCLSLIYMLYASAVGMYLGIVFLVTENLYIVMITHAFYDFVMLVWLVRRPLLKLNKFSK